MTESTARLDEIELFATAGAPCLDTFLRTRVTVDKVLLVIVVKSSEVY